jgi:EpsI family protein
MDTRWSIVRNLEENIYQFLDLDDYIFRTYEKDGVQITLYIGFYYTADKVSAAHSPLVCFPGQGWTITEPEYKQLKVGDHQINYAQIDATLGNQKELIVYWYQSHDDTVTVCLSK